MKYRVLPWLIVVFFPFRALAGEGLLIFKSNLWQKEEFARSLPYRSVDKFPTVHNVTDSAGEKTRISSELVLKDCPFPSTKDLANLREESQIQPLETMLAEWTAALRRYPSCVKYLKPRIVALQQEIARFRAGEVKADGEWMSKGALEARQRRLAEEQEQLMKKLAREAREMALTAAEWEAMDEASRQRTRDARQAALLAQIAMNEQQRVDAEIQRQSELAAMRARMKPFEKLATDDSVLPPSLSEEQAKEYKAALAKLNDALKPGRHELAFKREAQKFVFIAPDAIHSVQPKDLSTEVRVVKSDSDVEPATFELRTHDGKANITTYRKDTDEPRRNTLVVLPVAGGLDLVELEQTLSRLIALTGGKAETPVSASPEAR